MTDRLSAALRARGGAYTVLAIDGMAAAGKTTLAASFGAPVVHMDDFFLPPALRTDIRLGTPGGNVHYERFISEVLPGLAAGGDFSYRRFDCGAMDYAGVVHIPAARLLVVEGAYAMHPAFGDYADITVFLGVDGAAQRERVLRRDGPEGWERFRALWIPMENRYHAACRTRERADIVLDAAEFDFERTDAAVWTNP